MQKNEWLLFWVIGLIAVAIWVGVSFWSREARLQRRRRKSHSRLVSKSGNRPTVKFSVRTPGEKTKE